MKASRSVATPKPERDGILAVMQDQPTLDRLQGVIRELQLDDELVVTDTLDSALRRIRSGSAPRILLVDLADSAAPIAEVSAARAIGGADLKLVALGTVNPALCRCRRLPGQALKPGGARRGVRKEVGSRGGDARWTGAGDRVYRQPRRRRCDNFGCLLCLAAFYGTPRADRARRCRSVPRPRRARRGEPHRRFLRA